jgi:hypothetical protein
MAPMMRFRATVVSVLMAFAMVVVIAPPASAHTVSGQGSSNFQSRVLAITPAVPGLSVKMVELGSLVQMTWTGADDLIVKGYDGEPYLRVGPDGVWRNRRSTATYLNTTRYGSVTIPADANDQAPPVWVQISSGRTVLFHDHRTHWMGGVLPARVRNSPGTFQPVFQKPWQIDLTEAGRPIAVTGQLYWVPGVSALPWVAIIVVLAVLGMIAGAMGWWAAGLAGLAAVIIAADIVHAVGTGLFFVGTLTHRLLLIIGGSYYSVVAWVLGVVAIRFLSRRSLDGVFAAVFTGMVIGIFGGLTDIGSLTHSQIPFDFGATLARLIVAVSIGGSAGLVVGSIVAYRRNRVPAPVDADT